MRMAKTAFPGLSSPITHVDVTYDGKWILGTTDTYLILICTIFIDKDGKENNGFSGRMGNRIAAPRLQKLNPLDSHLVGADNRFMEGRFSWRLTMAESSRRAARVFFYQFTYLSLICTIFIDKDCQGPPLLGWDLPDFLVHMTVEVGVAPGLLPDCPAKPSHLGQTGLFVQLTGLFGRVGPSGFIGCTSSPSVSAPAAVVAAPHHKDGKENNGFSGRMGNRIAAPRLLKLNPLDYHLAGADNRFREGRFSWVYRQAVTLRTSKFLSDLGNSYL